MAKVSLSDLSSPSLYNETRSLDNMLARYDAYIVSLARQMLPRKFVNPALIYDEIEELAQKTRIKLWEAAQRQTITNLRAYIKCIVHHESINIIRRCRPHTPLPADYEDELYYRNEFIALNEGLRDPAQELEMEESFANTVEKAVEGVLSLPARQQQAMVCSLNDRISDLLPLIEGLTSHKADLEMASWPEDGEEVQRLRASLSCARRKLRSMLEA